MLVLGVDIKMLAPVKGQIMFHLLNYLLIKIFFSQMCQYIFSVLKPGVYSPPSERPSWRVQHMSRMSYGTSGIGTRISKESVYQIACDRKCRSDDM